MDNVVEVLADVNASILERTSACNRALRASADAVVGEVVLVVVVEAAVEP